MNTENNERNKKDEWIAYAVIILAIIFILFLMRGCEAPQLTKIKNQVSGVINTPTMKEQSPKPSVDQQTTGAEQNLNIEAEKLRLAEEVEQQRLAAEAEQQRLAAEAEQQRLASEAEQQRLAAEAEQQRLASEAEQQRLASEAEQQRLAAEAEQQRLASEAEQQRLAAEAEQKRLTEEASSLAKVLEEKKDTVLQSLNAFGQKVGDMFSFTLPNETTINIPNGGIEQKLLKSLMASEKGEHYIFDRIYFTSGSSTLDTASANQVDTVSKILNAHEVTAVTLRGHTDSVGPNNDNQKLSLKRVKRVEQALKKAGLKATITITGLGETQPADTNDTKQGRRNNRRIDFSID